MVAKFNISPTLSYIYKSNTQNKNSWVSWLPERGLGYGCTLGSCQVEKLFLLSQRN